MASSALPFVAAAVAHFIIGWSWAQAIMARPMSMSIALFGTFAAGAFIRVAFAMGTSEVYFAWAGALAAAALFDRTTPRGIAYWLAALVAGYVALVWLAP
jgi:hypothetical protein